jgi:hypothetical protein
MNLPALPQPNRLTIAHLMLWTLGSAIILGCFRALTDPAAELPEEVNRVLPFYQLGMSLALGAQVGGVLLFGWRRIAGRGGFPQQPGHWLLLVEGLSAIFVVAAYGLYQLLNWQDETSLYVYFALQIPNLLVCTIGYGLALGHTPADPPWRFAFGLCALLYGGLCLVHLLAIGLWQFTADVRLSFGAWDVLGIVVLVVNFADRRTYSHRDFLHWVGIAALIANVALMAGYRFAVIGF